MRSLNRRRFLTSTAAAAGVPLLPDLGFLAPLSCAAAADTQIDPKEVRPTWSTQQLVKLIQSTPRDKCIPVFIEQLKAGLSYQDFLSALFLATIEHGDPHQVAGIYSAHRVSSEARTEERLLPLFWALDRLVGGFEDQAPRKLTAFTEGLPKAGEAAAVYQESMVKLDPQQAERAIVVLARTQGPRHAMSLLWEFGARRVNGTLGHHPIAAANTWRTLEALGWQHAEPVLRYLARYFAGDKADRTYEPNRERIRKTLPALPADWAVNEPNRGVTLEVYDLLRQGNTDATCDLFCTQLASGEAKAGAMWDAIHLVAADLLFRYKTGGSTIRGYLIHAVTSTNALRFGFDCTRDDRARLLLLLQGAGVLGDLFVETGHKEGQLRAMNLLDLKAAPDRITAAIADVFEMLPKQANVYPPDESNGQRAASDEACRISFAQLQASANILEFKRTARSLLCVKATDDPHDLKYPVAAFEDADLVSPHWRPYLVAASVHALHGTASADSSVLVKAREALRS
ncbi:MAG: hypothetical protein WD894_07660 [Pirellulales bacterium]